MTIYESVRKKLKTNTNSYYKNKWLRWIIYNIAIGWENSDFDYYCVGIWIPTFIYKYEDGEGNTTTTLDFNTRISYQRAYGYESIIFQLFGFGISFTSQWSY